MKHAIFILTDPKGNTEEALTRLLNALGFADECQRHGDELNIIFAGTGTRWPAELTKLGHPANERYNQVREHVLASKSCAARNGATESLQAAGIPLVGDNLIQGTAGVVSYRRYHAEGWTVSLF